MRKPTPIGLTAAATTFFLALAGTGHAADPPSSRRGASGRGSATVGAQPLAQGYFGLNEFSFAFGNGDHKLKEVGLLTRANTMRAAFADNDGNDPFTFKSHHYKLPPGVKMYEKSTSCVRSCLVPIARGGANYHFVLVGFSFKKKKDDMHVHSIHVEPKITIDKAEVLVAYIDDGGKPSFDVTLQYAYVHESYVIGKKDHKLQKDKKGKELDFRLPYPSPGNGCYPVGIPVLQGFKFAFRNGAHFVEEMAVRFDHGQPIVRFRDKDTHDPYYAMVNVVYLNL